MLLSSPDHLDHWGKPHLSPYAVTYCFFAYIFLFLNIQYRHHQFAFVVCESVIPCSSLCNAKFSCFLYSRQLFIPLLLQEGLDLAVYILIET